MFIKIFSILVSIFGVLMSIGHFPQAFKIRKNKSSKEISLITYFIFFVGSFLWVVYGLLTKDIPIIVSFVIGVIGSWLVLFFSLKYKNN